MPARADGKLSRECGRCEGVYYSFAALSTGSGVAMIPPCTQQPRGQENMRIRMIASGLTVLTALLAYVQGVIYHADDAPVAAQEQRAAEIRLEFFHLMTDG